MNEEELAILRHDILNEIFIIRESVCLTLEAVGDKCLEENKKLLQMALTSSDKVTGLVKKLI